MKEKIFTDIAYIVIVLTVIGQCVVGANFYFGQFAFLIANLLGCTRDIVLKRPRADKVKNFTFLGITAGLILFRYFLHI